MASEQQLATLHDLKRLRTLKLAQARMHKLLGVGGAPSWVDEEREEDMAQYALLRSEARARMREAGSARKVGVTVSFKLGGGGAIRVPLPYPLHKVRAIRAVGGAVPHPLYTSFRTGRDDRVAIAYTQRWEVPQLRLRASSSSAAAVGEGSTRRRVVLQPDVVPGGSGTAATCFGEASAGAAAIALEGVQDARLIGLLSGPFVLMVGPHTAAAPAGALYSLTVATNLYQVHLLTTEPPPHDRASYVVFRSAGNSRARATSWSVDGDYLQPDGALHLELVAEHTDTHPASAGLANCISALVAAGGVTLLRTATTTAAAVSIERVGRAVLQLEGSTLTGDEAAFVLEAAIARYARLLELGAAGSASSATYFRIGCYGERLSFVLDPPSTAAATQVSFLFGSADPEDRNRQAALALGFAREEDVVFLRGAVQVAPAPYMHHRTGRTVRVHCEETASRAGGGRAPPAWFEYGAHDDSSSNPDQRTVHLGSGRAYGHVDCSPEISKLDALTLHFSAYEAGMSGAGTAEEQQHDVEADPHTTYSLAIEAEVAPL